MMPMDLFVSLCVSICHLFIDEKLHGNNTYVINIAAQYTRYPFTRQTI